MINKLPIEITQLIISHIGSSDLLSLSLVNKKFHHLIVPRLFKKIIINNQSVGGNNTNVTKLYNLKILFKRLIQCPELCSHVQSLVFIKIPDLPEHDIFNYFRLILPNLHNLVEFKWYPNYNLDLKLVNLIPSKLQVLNGNFSNFQYLSYQFHHLTSLSLSGFKNFENVNIDLNNFPDLKKLKISKKNLLHIEDPLHNIFHNSNKLKLTNLTFENLYLTAQDIELLKEKLDFSECRNLKFLNCYDHNNLDLYLPNLTHLELDLVNTDNQHIYQILSKMRLHYLSINLHISHDVNANLHNLLSVLDSNIKSLDLNFTISNNKLAVLDYYNGQSLFKLLSKFQNLECLKIPIFFKNLSQLNLNLPKLSTIQFNLIDLIKFKNTLVNFEVSTLSNDVFSYILTKLNDLKFIIIKLNQFHIFDVQNKNLNVCPTLF